MSTRAQAPVKAPLTPASPPARTGLLQRTCACGGTPGHDGECAECRDKRLARTVGASSMEPRFAHDFSRVRVHTEARAAAPAEENGETEEVEEVEATAPTNGPKGVTPGGSKLGPTNERKRNGKLRKRPRVCREKWDTSRLKLDIDTDAPGLRAFNKGAFSVFDSDTPLIDSLTGCSAECVLFRQFVKIKRFENGIEQPKTFLSCGRVFRADSADFVEEDVTCFGSESSGFFSWNDKPGIVWPSPAEEPQFARFDFTVRVMIWDSCLGIPKKALEGRIVLLKDGPEKTASVTPFKDIRAGESR